MQKIIVNSSLYKKIKKYHPIFLPYVKEEKSLNPQNLKDFIIVDSKENIAYKIKPIGKPKLKVKPIGKPKLVVKPFKCSEPSIESTLADIANSIKIPDPTPTAGANNLLLLKKINKLIEPDISTFKEDLQENSTNSREDIKHL